VIIDQPIKQFLDELSSKSPTPGGGSAAAVVGAIGAALVAMVCNLTLGKRGYEEVQETLLETRKNAESVRQRLMDLVQADVRAFDGLMAAYGLPKEDDEQRKSRNAAIQKALMEATDVPLECAEACSEVIRLSRAVADTGNRNLISDAGVAVLAGYAGVKSAALNVYVNTAAIEHPGFVSGRIEKLDLLLGAMDQEMMKLYDDIRCRL